MKYSDVKASICPVDKAQRFITGTYKYAEAVRHY